VSAARHKQRTTLVLTAVEWREFHLVAVVRLRSAPFRLVRFDGIEWNGILFGGGRRIWDIGMAFLPGKGYFSFECPSGRR
jgi:hypothetical protein